MKTLKTNTYTTIIKLYAGNTEEASWLPATDYTMYLLKRYISRNIKKRMTTYNIAPYGNGKIEVNCSYTMPDYFLDESAYKDFKKRWSSSLQIGWVSPEIPLLAVAVI